MRTLEMHTETPEREYPSKQALQHFACLLGIAFREPARQNLQRGLAAALEFDFHGGLQVVDIPDGDAAHGLPRLDFDGLGVPIVAVFIVQGAELQSLAFL